MPEENDIQTVRVRKIHHRGRISQVGIYLGKQLRFFVNESDWKVLPMAAVIAVLVGMVIRNRLFINMEGTLIGAFSLACLAIWNGCFNSIQAVCRERAIIKREHRSGMHVSSYVAAHMIYQLLLCLAQTALTMYVLKFLGVQFSRQAGLITRWMIADIGISMLLISYAADMMSLFISSVSRTTTGAMTVMPFILIFQLVFSGGIIPLPAGVQKFSDYTISSYGIRAIVSQSNYNNLPMATGWNTLNSMRDAEINETITIGQLLDLLDSPAVEKRRDLEVIDQSAVSAAAGITGIPEEIITSPVEPVTLGEITDFLKSSRWLQENRDKSYRVKATVGEVIEILGEENVRDTVQQRTAEAAQKAEYTHSIGNVAGNWTMLLLFIFAFAALATLALEMIDKDKR